MTNSNSNTRSKVTNLTQPRSATNPVTLDKVSQAHSLAKRLTNNCRKKTKLQLNVLATFSNFGLFCVVLSTLLAGCQIQTDSFSVVNGTIDLGPSPQVLKFSKGGDSVQAVFVGPDTVWIEYGRGEPSSLQNGLPTSQMLDASAKINVLSEKPTLKESSADLVLSTATADLKVFKDSLCAEILPKAKPAPLSQATSASKSFLLCPHRLAQPLKTLSFAAPDVQSIFGLGQYFRNPQTADGSLLGQTIKPGPFGNELRGFSGGANSTIQFPGLTVNTRSGSSFFTIFDNVYRQEWGFGPRSTDSDTGWGVSTYGEKLRVFASLPQSPQVTRSSFMEFLGRPPVPPRKMFGLWLSEFGYDNWDEVFRKEKELKDAEIPVDGMVLDLQWFGGEFFGQRRRMGTLQFDDVNFPLAPQRILELNDRGVGLMTVEESYIDEKLKEHSDLAARGFMVKGCETCGPSRITQNPWWGIGGMLDWSQPAAGAYWHKEKRKPLADLGIIGHWTDLGEPEMYDPQGWYKGDAALRAPQDPELHGHADYHNLYAMLWSKSISDGYKKETPQQRNFILTRSGTLGIQRYGAALWSGDIGANLGALKAQFNSQSQMFYSGVDYYGSDIGGFHRYSLDGDLNSLYTQWMAQSSLLDFPVRPHAWNTDNSHETSPAKVGHLPSNKANLELRYQLFPYYYSLAHELSRKGTPLVAPPSFYYPLDPVLAEIGHQKMIGPFLLTGLVADYNGFQRSFYFPKDDWFDFRTGEFLLESDKVAVKKSGTWKPSVSTVSELGNFELPLYARDGALVPMSPLRSLHAHASLPKDLLAESGLRLRVFPRSGEGTSQFTLSEDDGWSTESKLKGMTSRTVFQQESSDGLLKSLKWSGEDAPKFSGQLPKIPMLLEVAHKGRAISGVTWGGVSLAKCDVGVEFESWEGALGKKYESVSPCFAEGQNNHFSYVWLGIVTRLGGGSVDMTWSEKADAATTKKDQFVVFVCPRAKTSQGESWYVVGNTENIGKWDPARAEKLQPVLYPNWAKKVGGFEKDTSIEWKCVKKNDASQQVLSWQSGKNNTTTISSSRFGAIALGEGDLN